MHGIRLHHVGLVAISLLAFRSNSTAAEAIQFLYRTPEVGQQGAHEMQFSLDLNIKLQQAGQTVSSDSQHIGRDQERHVTVLEVDDNKVTKVQVLYRKATEMAARGDQQAKEQTQPIEGKTYLVERRGKDLVVTDLDGKSVSEEERVLVAASMEAVGHPSPLGTFLHGKKLAVGETLRLPNEMASSLLGVKEAGGEAQKVELTLRNVQLQDQHRVADFAMLIVLSLPGGGTINVHGGLQIDPDSCQVTGANFEGPVSMHEQHGPKGHTFEVNSDGAMKVAVRSHYLK